MTPREILGHGGLGEVAGETRRRAACGRFQFGDRSVDRGLRAPVDDDARAFASERLRDRVSDARGAAADQRELTGELKIHIDPALVD